MNLAMLSENSLISDLANYSAVAVMEALEYAATESEIFELQEILSIYFLNNKHILQKIRR